MTLRELRQLVREGEGSALEFKLPAIKPGDLAESFAAMANAGGGLVLLGVDDSGRMVGVASLKEAHDLIEIAATECLNPPLTLRTSVVRSPRGHAVLVTRVRRSSQPVFSVSGRLLVRRGSRNVPVTSIQAQELFSSGGSADAEFPYEILSHNIVLVLHDATGEHATLTRQARVRFLQDQVLALHDRVWGKGELSPAVYVRPGKVADQYTRNRQVHTLISLREPKRRGEVATIEVVSRFQAVFTRDEEGFDVDVDLPTRFLRFEIRFPEGRPPREAWLTEHLGGSKQALKGSNVTWVKNGVRIVWRRSQPRLRERYRTGWRW